MTIKRLHTILANTLRNQAARHGITLPDAVVRDISGNQAQAIAGLCDDDERPRTDIDREQCWRPADDHGGCWDFTECEVGP